MLIREEPGLGVFRVEDADHFARMDDRHGKLLLIRQMAFEKGLDRFGRGQHSLCVLMSLPFIQRRQFDDTVCLARHVIQDRVEIGPIVRRDLRATVAAEGKLEQSLLGMNFISSLTSFEMRKDEVILKD